MVKRIAAASLITLIILFLLLNRYYRIEYNTGISDFFSAADRLTPAEQKWLKQHKTIIFSADKNSPPMRFVNENNQYIGIVIDYLSALSIELGIEIRFIPMQWDEAQKKLAGGKVDIADMFPSEERAKKYDFSNPIYFMRGVLLTDSYRTGINSPSDAEGRTVAITKGDFAEGYMKKRFKNIKVVPTNDTQEAVGLLLDGKVDCVAGDEPVISYLVQRLKAGKRYTIISQPLYQMDNVLAVTKGNAMLLSILNKGIANLKRKNVLSGIQSKWFGISTPIVNSGVKERIFLATSATAVLAAFALYIMLIWNSLLSKEVHKRTSELVQNRNDLQTVFDSLTLQIAVLDREMRILSVNAAFCNFVSCLKEGIIGMRFSSLGIIPADADGNVIADTFSTGTSGTLQFEYKGITFELKTFPVRNMEGDTVKVLVMFEDITMKKLNEAHILQANKMVAIGQLAAGLAHEIRNPLGLIRNHTFLLKGTENMPEAMFRKSIATIEMSIDKASSVIENMLNFSRLSGDTRTGTNMSAFIRDIVELLAKEAQSSGVSHRIECDEELNININAESFKHIIINLVSNAVDAMPEGGELVVSCGMKGVDLVLEVKDSGIGISRKDMNNLFNPFFTTKPPGQGTGLGLYIVYSEVMKHGGHVDVKSTIGSGTTFTVYVPAVRRGDVKHG